VQSTKTECENVTYATKNVLVECRTRDCRWNERLTIIELLEVRIERKRQKRAYQHDLVERYRIAFEDGRLTQAELTSARQEALAVGSELKDLGILLEHYIKLVR